MDEINASKVRVEGNKIYISNKFRKFTIKKDDILCFAVRRIPSFFEEIAIELQCSRSFIVTERISGFFELAKFLHVEELFGALWYSDAESGREMKHVSGSS